jgi:hypothetical protein
MIEPAHDLATTKQAKALNISRGSVHHLPRPVPEADLAIMRRLEMRIEALYRRPRTTKPEPGHNLPLSAARDGDCPAEPGVGDGHHLHPDGTRPAWTVKGLGGTTCSPSVYGAASNTRRCICGPTKAYPRPALRSAATWTFIMAGVHT